MIEASRLKIASFFIITKHVNDDPTITLDNNSNEYSGISQLLCKYLDGEDEGCTVGCVEGCKVIGGRW
jgi:hypothetical protein